MQQTLSSVLFPGHRRRVVGLLVLLPENALHGRENARRTGPPSGTLTRELVRRPEIGAAKAQFFQRKVRRMDSMATSPASQSSHPQARARGFACHFCGAPLETTFVDLGISPPCKTYILPGTSPGCIECYRSGAGFEQVNNCQTCRATVDPSGEATENRSIGRLRKRLTGKAFPNHNRMPT